MTKARIIIPPRSSHPAWVVACFIGVNCYVKQIGPVTKPDGGRSVIDYVSFDRREVMTQIFASGPEGRNAASWLSQNTTWDSLDRVIFPVTCVQDTSYESEL
jgi:hypothetical protein